MTTMTYELLPINQPSRSGRLYTTEVCEQIVKDFHTKTEKVYGTLDNAPNYKLDVSQISHEVSDVFIENGNLMATVKIVPTEQGKILSELNMALPDSLQGVLSGMGMYNKVSSGGQSVLVISDFTFLTVGIETVPILFPGKTDWFTEVMGDMEKSGLL